MLNHSLSQITESSFKNWLQGWLRVLKLGSGSEALVIGSVDLCLCLWKSGSDFKMFLTNTHTTPFNNRILFNSHTAN